MKHVDVIIVGQGLAGSLLAHFLMESGCSVLVIDDDNPRAATQVAAGLINPVTGRYFVKSWRVDDLIPFAQHTYQNLEKRLHQSFYHPRNVLRALSCQGDENDWLGRSADPAYQAYIVDPADLSAYEGKINPAFAYGELQHAAQVDIGLLCKSFRNLLIEKNAFSQDTFNFNNLSLPPSPAPPLAPSPSRPLSYRDTTATTLVFCEGAKAKSNPFFNYLPFVGDKGEVLIVKIPGAFFSKMLKQGIFIIPIGPAEDELYWVGATYERRYDSDEPTLPGKNYLVGQLREVLTMPFEIIDHRSAIRPTVKDRRPFLGRHPQYPQLAIFNGLGTKGASLAPYWAKHMADMLIYGKQLDSEVDIARFLTKN